MRLSLLLTSPILFLSIIKHLEMITMHSIASSLFPMLGILGTFTAIAISMPDFSSSNEAALNHEISLLLSGIGTAFYASIYGIFLSIVWSFFEKRGLSKVDEDSHELHDVYSSYIWSPSELRKHEHMQHEMRDQKNGTSTQRNI